jgi:hypothetical protein
VLTYFWSELARSEFGRQIFYDFCPRSTVNVILKFSYMRCAPVLWRHYKMKRASNFSGNCFLRILRVSCYWLKCVARCEWSEEEVRCALWMFPKIYQWKIICWKRWKRTILFFLSHSGFFLIELTFSTYSHKLQNLSFNLAVICFLCSLRRRIYRQNKCIQDFTVTL